ncbi:Mitochondrial glycine transporter B, partial [Dissostichus eleginoides]
MARTLLMGIFSVDVLLKSNLTGGLNKVDPTAERRQALDGKKLQALLGGIKNPFNRCFPGIGHNRDNNKRDSTIVTLCVQVQVTHVGGKP